MKLKRELGFWDVFSISTGAMISSGIFILPGIAFSKGGPSIIISYFLGGIIALMGILSVIELTTAMPKAGGDYFFVERTLGPLVGTISGVLSWFAISLKSAFAIYGMSGVIVGLVYGSFNTNKIVAIAALITVFFVILNIVGVEVASKFEVVIVAALLVLMVLYIALGIFKVDLGYFKPFFQKFEIINGAAENLRSKTNFTFTDVRVVISTTALVFVSFGGLLKAASVSEEVKDTHVNIVYGLISSIICISILYVLVLFVTIGNLEGERLATSITPIADGARNIAGLPGYIAITAAAMLAFISTANAGIMAASRYPLALSRDGLFPEFISRVSKKFKTPVISIVLTGCFISFSLFLPLETLAKTASAVILMTYILTNMSVIILRESNMVNYQPTFKAPFYPWVQIFIVVVFTYFITKLGYSAVETSLGLIMLSIFIYFKYGKKNAIQEYALLHLLMRITENLKLEHDLESEFRDIIHDRDSVELDEFDKLVKNAVILDLKGHITLDELFEIEAERLEKILDVPKEELIRLFNERERESSTAITEFTAIPHIVLDREDLFNLVVIRCKEGIRFNEKKQTVKAVFLFISSSGVVKTHLKTLASIASLTTEEDFESKWMSAKNENYLRDMILLSKRKRFVK